MCPVAKFTAAFETEDFGDARKTCPIAVFRGLDQEPGGEIFGDGPFWGIEPDLVAAEEFG